MSEDFVKRPINYLDHIDSILDERLAAADERLLAAVTAALDLEGGLAEITGKVPGRPAASRIALIASTGDDLRATQASGLSGARTAAPAPAARAVVAADRPSTPPGKAAGPPRAGLRARRNQTAPPGRPGKRARGSRRRNSVRLVLSSPLLVVILVGIFAVPHWVSAGSVDLPVAESTSTGQSPDGAVHSTAGQENGASGDQATRPAGVTRPRNSASGRPRPVSSPAPAMPQPVSDGSAPSPSTGSGTGTGTGTGASGGTSDGSPGSAANPAATVAPPGLVSGDLGPWMATGPGAGSNESACSGTVCYVTFAPGLDQLSDRAKARLLRWLKGVPSSTSQLTITGFDDNDGAGVNPGLGASRANAVADYLHAQHPVTQITVGEGSRPSAVRQEADVSVTAS